MDPRNWIHPLFCLYREPRGGPPRSPGVRTLESFGVVEVSLELGRSDPRVATRRVRARVAGKLLSGEQSRVPGDDREPAMPEPVRRDVVRQPRAQTEALDQRLDRPRRERVDTFSGLANAGPRIAH